MYNKVTTMMSKKQMASLYYFIFLSFITMILETAGIGLIIPLIQSIASDGMNQQLLVFLNIFNLNPTSKHNLILILTLIILVAAFNIISSMIMLVRSKNADIAVLRTMGISRLSLLKIFLLTGTSIGIIGTIFGGLIGLLFCWNIDGIKVAVENITGSELFSAEIYFLSKLPAVVEPKEVAVVMGMALILSLLASIYPAWRASFVAPAEALRYE